MPQYDQNVGDFMKGSDYFQHELAKANEIAGDVRDIMKEKAQVAILTALKNPEMTTFDEYLNFVKSMKVYPEKHAIVYPTLGMMGEAGEVSEKVKKWMRGDKELDKLEVLKEAGDVLWYIASLADDLGYTLQDLVNENVKKLKSRKERGVQKGDGDNR